MATSFNYVILPHRRKKDGTIPVNIRMTHHGKSKYATTSLVVTRDQITRKQDKITDQIILDAVNRKLADYRRAVAAIDGAEYYSADDLWEAVNDILKGGNRTPFHLDIFEFGRDKMAAMEPKTAEGYQTSLNALKRFIGTDTLDINDITYQFLLKFRHFLETEPPLANGKGKHQAKTKSSRAVSFYLSCLRSLHNMARAECNQEETGKVAIPLQPFKKGLIPAQPMTQHRVLTAAQTKAIAAVQLRQGSQAELARDVFMLSLAMIGENTIDLYHATEDELKDGIQTYNRRKTDSVRQDNALMKVRIEPEAERLIERYRATDGHHLLNFHTRYSGQSGAATRRPQLLLRPPHMVDAGHEHLRLRLRHRPPSPQPRPPWSRPRDRHLRGAGLHQGMGGQQESPRLAEIARKFPETPRKFPKTEKKVHFF